MAIMLMAQVGYSFGGPVAKIIVMNNPSMTVFEIIYWKSFSMLFMNYTFCRFNGV
jgi:alpha/beta superfamily hydrolase